MRALIAVNADRVLAVERVQERGKTMIDMTAIAALPWYAGVPGLLFVALCALKAIRSLLTLRVIKAFTNAVTALVALVLLSNLAKLGPVFIGPSS